MLKCRVMLDIVLIKCCTSDVVPFLFIYVMCIIFLMDCFTFKHCLVSNFARVYFISYMSHLRKYLYIFNVLSFSLGQTRVPKCPNPYKPNLNPKNPNNPQSPLKENQRSKTKIQNHWPTPGPAILCRLCSHPMHEPLA